MSQGVTCIVIMNALPLSRFHRVLCAMMSSSIFIRWKERIENTGALMIFWSSFVVGCRFLRWARRTVSVLATRHGCQEGRQMNYLLASPLVWSPIGAGRIVVGGYVHVLAANME